MLVGNIQNDSLSFLPVGKGPLNSYKHNQQDEDASHPGAGYTPNSAPPLLQILLAGMDEKKEVHSIGIDNDPQYRSLEVGASLGYLTAVDPAKE